MAHGWADPAATMQKNELVRLGIFDPLSVYTDPTNGMPCFGRL